MTAERAPEPPPADLAGIVLAAGGASRFGGPKQLARVGGSSLVVRAAQLALGSCPAGVVVVTGAYAAEVEAGLSGMPVTIARNPGWAGGIAGSIRRGVEALPAGSAACLVLLCDQVAVDECDIGSLVGAWAKAPRQVAAALYAGTLGVPAIFPQAFWPRLQRLGGDQGARALVAQLAAVTAVAMPHAGRDVDTPADLDGPAGP